MADKTTTLKTKTGDNVYPNIKGENRKDSFVDSSTITHHFYDQTHKVGFQIANETNIKIQNSLQKPSGLTKTKLVGVGTNGQENIEIGDNLTLTNGKLSATGGGGSGGVENNILTGKVTKYSDEISGTFTGRIDLNKINKLFLSEFGNMYIQLTLIMTQPLAGYAVVIAGLDWYALTASNGDDNVGMFFMIPIPINKYSHFITMTDSANNVALYLTIQNISEDEFSADTLASYFAGKKVLANGNLHGSVPTYIAGEGGIIKVYYRTPGDSNINPTPDEYQDLSSFTITDLVTPVE